MFLYPVNHFKPVALLTSSFKHWEFKVLIEKYKKLLLTTVNHMGNVCNSGPAFWSWGSNGGRQSGGSETVS